MLARDTVREAINNGYNEEGTSAIVSRDLDELQSKSIKVIMVNLKGIMGV
jgi:hypothetical protein